jgi:hypothetical protein
MDDDYENDPEDGYDLIEDWGSDGVDHGIDNDPATIRRARRSLTRAETPPSAPRRRATRATCLAPRARHRTG